MISFTSIQKPSSSDCSHSSNCCLASSSLNDKDKIFANNYGLFYEQSTLFSLYSLLLNVSVLCILIRKFWKCWTNRSFLKVFFLFFLLFYHFFFFLIWLYPDDHYWEIKEYVLLLNRKYYSAVLLVSERCLLCICSMNFE